MMPDTTPSQPVEMVHTMVDLETFSNANNALIVSIGAVKFTRTAVLERFEVGIDPENAQRYGLRIDAGTVMWWLHPDQAEARQALLDLPKIGLYEALDGLSMWLSETPEDRRGSCWGNGSVYDNVKLKSAYDAVNLEYPFSYKHDECYRTLRNRFPDVEFERVGTFHKAVDDAESQARHLIAICEAHPGLQL